MPVDYAVAEQRIYDIAYHGAALLQHSISRYDARLLSHAHGNSDSSAITCPQPAYA